MPVDGTIQLAYQDTAWFNDPLNAEIILKEGQHVYLSDGADEFLSAYVVGDDVTELQDLPWKGLITGVQSVTGPNVDDTDPVNPVVNTPTLQEVTDETVIITNPILTQSIVNVLDSSFNVVAALDEYGIDVTNSTNSALLFDVHRPTNSVKKLGIDLQTVNFDKDKNNFRLSLTSGLSVTTSDVVNAQTIYLTPHNGNVISLFNGTNWVLYESNEISLALGTLMAGNYDVFCYANAGVPTLEFTAWTGSTTPVATTKLNGVTVKVSDNTRRLVGSFTSIGNQSATVTISNATPAAVTYTGHGLKNNAPVVFTTTGALPSGLVAGNTYYLADLGTSTANTFNVSATPGGAVIATTTAGSGIHTCTVGTYTEDSNANRCLENFDNAVLRMMHRAEQTFSWAYNGVFRQVNANLLNQINFINRSDEYISAIANVRVACSNAAGIMALSISLNNTSAQQLGATAFVPQGTANDAEPVIANFDKLVSTGYNYLSICENSSSATTTWYGGTALYCQITGYKLG